MKQKNNLFVFLIIIFILIIGFLLINNINNQPKKLTKITYKEIEKKVENKDDFILVISRTTCSHCQSYKPKLQEIVKKYNITIYYIDIDEEKKADEFLEKYNLDGATPVTIFIKNGKETSILNRLEGDLEIDKVEKRLKEMNFIK